MVPGQQESRKSVEGFAHTTPISRQLCVDEEARVEAHMVHNATEEGDFPSIQIATGEATCAHAEADS